MTTAVRASAVPAPSGWALSIPWAFVGLVFALSVPFWVLGATTDLRLTPALSIGSGMIVAPFAAAVILVARRSGVAGVRTLLGRAVDVRGLRPRAWLLPIFLLMPALAAAEIVVLRLAGVPVPPVDVTVAEVVVAFGMYLVAAELEEVGWSGYAIDPLLSRWSALVASIVLGAVWGAWHLPAILEMPVQHPPEWVALQVAEQVFARIVIVWVFMNTRRSVLAAVLIHTMMNVSTQVFIPVDGSYYDPLVTDLLLAAVVVVIVAVWGVRTLAEPRFGRRRPTGPRPTLPAPG